jgi:hypothetical protein
MSALSFDSVPDAVEFCKRMQLVYGVDISAQRISRTARRCADQTADHHDGGNRALAREQDGSVSQQYGGRNECLIKRLNFGVIGCGLMGREFASASLRWLHLLGDVPRPAIIAACDTNQRNLDWFRRDPDTKYFYNDYQEMLKTRRSRRSTRGAASSARKGVWRRDPRGQTPDRRKTIRTRSGSVP